jgi:hypothetical protein
VPLLKGKQIATGANGIKATNLDTSEVPSLASGGTFTGALSIATGNTLTVPTPATDPEIANKDYVDQTIEDSIAVPTTSNKNMSANTTTADGQKACNTAIAFTPTDDGYVEVTVNGIHYTVGDGVKTQAAYFSADNGATARLVKDIVAGDFMHWNGSIAGYQLSTQDVIDFHYNVVAA